MATLVKLKPIVDETRRGQIVRHLRQLIVNGNVQPGERLTETRLADQLGVSRAPLREAIRDLVDSGLVESLPYKGLFVRSVTRQDLEELYSLRTALEQFAFQQCWAKRDPKARADLEQRHADLLSEIDRNEDTERAIELELHLHDWCYELAGHALLQKTWCQMKPNLQFYFTLHQKAHNRAGPLRQGHEVYVTCALGNSLDAMQDHLDMHMRQGLEATKMHLPTG